jgi:hypothetical protein
MSKISNDEIKLREIAQELGISLQGILVDGCTNIPELSISNNKHEEIN